MDKTDAVANGNSVAVPVEELADKILVDLSNKFQWLHNEVAKAFDVFKSHPARMRVADRIHFGLTSLEVAHFHVQQATQEVLRFSPVELEKAGEAAVARGDVVDATGAPVAVAAPAAPALTVLPPPEAAG